MKPLRAALLTLVLGLLLGPGAALAAPPDNDAFADREVLTGALPLEVTRSNVEATKEAGEFIPGLSAAGHSIWFEWEATSTDWVTIGSCDTAFPTILGVFTGTEIGNLTPAAGGNADEGPDCLGSPRQFTFKAIAGTKYVIAVDGNMFTGPETVPVQTEGEIALRLAETPTPSNDDFEDATAVLGSTSEEPNGDRFYFAATRGYNWTATTEGGEPGYGPSAGSSVWYSWTAPETASYRFGLPCCGTGLSRNVYTGNGFGELSPLLGGEEWQEVPLAAGTVVRIVVYGGLDTETGEPRMGSFHFFVSANLPRTETVAPNPVPPAPDTVAPETKIVQHALTPRIGLAKFRFRSTVTGSSFQCKLDRGAFKPCSSPKTYRRLKPGRHTFKVKAVSASGVTDSTAAMRRFMIAAPPRQHRR
jgi:hypothetical protein